ncbi:ASCH domain-containing protein [Latilactobacillus sakei]|nr:ASCH domain-containing protein [Latilactobacillus sakei]
MLDGQGKPAAITKTMSCKIIAYNKVSADHAYLEGEGDRTLDYWRAIYCCESLSCRAIASLKLISISIRLSF